MAFWSLLGPALTGLGNAAASIIAAIKGEQPAGASDNRALAEQVASLQQQLNDRPDLAEEERSGLNSQIESLQQAQAHMQQQLEDERNEQPQGPKEELVQQSREHWNLDEDKRNVSVSGLTCTGKSELVNRLTKVQGTEGDGLCCSGCSRLFDSQHAYASSVCRRVGHRSGGKH